MTHASIHETFIGDLEIENLKLNAGVPGSSDELLIEMLIKPGFKSAYEEIEEMKVVISSIVRDARFMNLDDRSKLLLACSVKLRVQFAFVDKKFASGFILTDDEKMIRFIHHLSSQTIKRHHLSEVQNYLENILPLFSLSRVEMLKSLSTSLSALGFSDEDSFFREMILFSLKEERVDQANSEPVRNLLRMDRSKREEALFILITAYQRFFFELGDAQRKDFCRRYNAIAKKRARIAVCLFLICFPISRPFVVYKDLEARKLYRRYFSVPIVNNEYMNHWVVKTCELSFSGFVNLISRDKIMAYKTWPSSSECSSFDRTRLDLSLVCFVSHKWFGDQPDKELRLFSHLRRFLKENLGVKWVWVDFLCSNQEDPLSGVIEASRMSQSCELLIYHGPSKESYLNSAWCLTELILFSNDVMSINSLPRSLDVSKIKIMKDSEWVLILMSLTSSPTSQSFYVLIPWFKSFLNLVIEQSAKYLKRRNPYIFSEVNLRVVLGESNYYPNLLTYFNEL